MIFNSLQFDGDNSLDHGVYITGEAIYSAPVRDTESIEIPGRNGDFILDKGRWKNIDVTYKAGLFGSDQENFADKIRTYRNILASRLGYKRITDTYNPNEFRLGKLKDGLDVETKTQKKAGEFDIVFDCKPQRFLISGEEEIEVSSGQTISNPTAYDASPLLLVEGYGEISIGDDIVTVEDVPLGAVKLNNAMSSTVTLDTSLLNAGDSIYAQADLNGPAMTIRFTSGNIGNITVDSTSGCSVGISTASPISAYLEVDPKPSFNFGTSGSLTASATLHIVGKGSGGSGNVTFTLTVSYDGNDTITLTRNNPTLPANITASYTRLNSIYYGDSTKSALPDPLYIDLDAGEAYGEIEGSILSLNSAVQLPATLPKLEPGANEVVFDNTINSLKIIPRWWIL